MVWYIMTHFGGKIPVALLCGQWYRQLLRFGDRRIFLDVNTAFFWSVVDYLNKQKYHVS